MLSPFTGHYLIPRCRGDIAMLSNMNTSVPDAPWCLHKLWTHGHTGVVRGLLWDEPVCALDPRSSSFPEIIFRIKHLSLEGKTARLTHG